MRFVHRLTLNVAALFFLASFPVCAQLSQQGNESTVQYSGTTAILISPNTPANPNLLASGFNTFLLGISNPNNSARIYVTNDTANACANLTVSVASTGSTTVTSFNNSLGSWQSLLLQLANGNFAASQPATLPASGTIAFTTSPIIGNRIAIFIVLSAGCNTTNLEAQVVFGNFTASGGNVQGTVAPGANGSTVNPLICGGIDSAGLVRSCVVQPFGTTGIQLNGLSIGGNTVADTATFTNIRMPGGSVDGPMATATYGLTQSNSLQMASIAPGTCSTLTNCNGLGTADVGFFTQSTTPGITSTGQSVQLWIPPQGNTSHSAFETCRFDVTIVNTAGTTPTLDAYIQDSLDGANWDDRVHFAQATTGTSRQAAGVAGGSANMPVHAYTNRTIAASTVTTGPIGTWGQIVFVVTGTTPSYNVTAQAFCK